jgi:hypothetical protein
MIGKIAAQDGQGRIFVHALGHKEDRQWKHITMLG